MTTKVIFNVDKKIKEKAMKVAKAQGITISDYLSMSLHDFAKGNKEVRIVEKLNNQTKKIVTQSLKDFKEGKTSPHFRTLDEGFAWLER